MRRSSLFGSHWLAPLAVTVALGFAACTTPAGASPAPSGMMEHSPAPSGMMEHSPAPSGMMEHSPAPSGMMEHSPSPSAP